MVYLGTSSSSSSLNGKTGSNGSNSNGASANAAPVVEINDDDDSPNGRNSVESASDEEREGRIRVGKDYQAVTPNFIEVENRRPEQCPERALLVWSPASVISSSKLDEYIQISKEKYGYNAEQALGMLFWHKHDLDKAIQDLANFTPFPDEWSVEDKVLFEQAFQFHGKSFHRIRQMLPDKTIAQLVKYYYSWKKTRTRTSLMDRQARKLQSQRDDQGYGAEDANGANESENEEEKESVGKPKCFNCGIMCHVTHSTPKGQMCGTCHQYYLRTGNVRPTTGPLRKDGAKSKHFLFKNNNKPPKGMYINHDDLVALATGPNPQGDALLKSMDREIVSYKRSVQNNKQYLSTFQRRTAGKSIEPYRIPEPSKDKDSDSVSKINPKWTNEELSLGVQGIRKFGKNFKMIAEILGTKTESHCRSFFVNYRRRYNLDSALKEYEAEHGPGVDSGESKDEPMETAEAEEDEKEGKDAKDKDKASNGSK